MRRPAINRYRPMFLAAPGGESLGVGGTVIDRSGNGNNLTLNGNAIVNGDGINFDGDQDYAVSPITAMFTRFTFVAWIKPGSTQKSWATIFGKCGYYASDTNDFPVLVKMDSTTTICAALSSGNDFALDATLTYTGMVVGTWTHIAVTHDNSYLRLYANGEQVNSVATGYSISTNARPYVIGRAASEYSDGVGKTSFNGCVSGALFFGRALAAYEIKQLAGIARR